MTKLWLALMVVLGVSYLQVATAEEAMISVRGVAEKSLEPNMVSMTMEIWSKAVSAKEAQVKAAKQFHQVKKTIEDFKIKKEDFKTLNYSLNPEYEYDQKLRQNKMIGFRVSQMLVVTLRKVDEAGLFLDQLVSEKKSLESGVSLNGIFWDSDKKGEAETAALGEAVRVAREKADEIAKAAHIKISGVLKISHSNATDMGQVPYRALAFGSSEKAAATELSGGDVKVRVEVSVDYRIKE